MATVNNTPQPTVVTRVRKAKTEVAIIDGRQVKVAQKDEVRNRSRKLITEYARALEILKDR